jgi:hypothetical protein
MIIESSGQGALAILAARECRDGNRRNSLEALFLF